MPLFGCTHRVDTHWVAWVSLPGKVIAIVKPGIGSPIAQITMKNLCGAF
jgi:hypothetical protein